MSRQLAGIEFDIVAGYRPDVARAGNKIVRLIRPILFDVEHIERQSVRSPIA